MYTPSERRCFFCNSQGLKECPGGQRDGTYFECVICGKYVLSRTFIDTFETVLGRRQAAKFSHLLAEQKFRNEEQEQAFATYDVDKFLQKYPNETEIPARILESLRIRKETLDLGYYDDVEVDLRVKAGNDWSWNTRWAYADNEQTFLNVVESLRERYGIKARIDLERNKAYFNIAPYFERIERRMDETKFQGFTINGNGNQMIVGNDNQIHCITNGADIQKLEELIKVVKEKATSDMVDVELLNEALRTLMEIAQGRQNKSASKLAMQILNPLRNIVGLGSDIAGLMTFVRENFLT